MIDQAAIQALCDQIVERFHPEKVVLFGSYAYGAPGPDSDVDLLVIMPFDGHPTRKAVEILNWIRPKFAVDLIVRTASEIAARIALDDFFLREITERGQVLYDAADRRVGVEG